MNIILIIAGIALLSTGIYRSVNSSESPANTADASPKANDHRIVKRALDGQYVIEYYRDWPGWCELGMKPGMKTEQEARERLVAIEGAQKEDEIIARQPTQP